jgi:pimeloyl-ACP methyl ester carboxylesterase
LADVATYDLTVGHGGVSLAGTLWMPVGAEARAVVVMHPGSGPSNRDNNGYFTPIRQVLLDASCGVASFDKRGVGASGGDWRRAPIEVQAGDLLASVRAIQARDEIGGAPIGLFGHSQGGWVVVEAASRTNSVDFVIVGSGPGVTPAAQERYSARRALEAAGASPQELEAGMRDYDEMVGHARSGAALSDLSSAALTFPDTSDPEQWKFWMSILDYDPKGPLSRITVPVLTLWGGDDRIVPVEDSIEVFRSAIPPIRLTVEVFEGADHRIQVGDPPRLAPGYAERIGAFLDANI